MVAIGIAPATAGQLERPRVESKLAPKSIKASLEARGGSVGG